MSDGSGAPPVPWLSTHAEQLTVPTGDDGRLMSDGSGAPSVLWLSAESALLSFFLPFAFVTLFRSSFVPLLRSPFLSVPM